MNETKKKKQLKTFPGLDPLSFQHPHDAAATDALRAVPGLDVVIAKVLEYGYEKLSYLENIADNVRVTPRMLPRLYKYLGWGCKILDVEEPELYVTLDPVPNAYTFGHKKPFIVLTSGLVDLLGDEELLFVIGHELGHIKSGHVLYTILARNIATIIAAIGQASFVIGALLSQRLVVALHDWYRKAELTSDRAAAFARYNLACYAALDGDLDRARDLLRLALPGQDELMEFAPKDDDLIALRDEIPALAVGS